MPLNIPGAIKYPLTLPFGNFGSRALAVDVFCGPGNPITVVVLAAVCGISGRAGDAVSFPSASNNPRQTAGAEDYCKRLGTRQLLVVVVTAKEVVRHGGLGLEGT
jgi:hypothetical protein